MHFYSQVNECNRQESNLLVCFSFFFRFLLLVCSFCGVEIKHNLRIKNRRKKQFYRHNNGNNREQLVAIIYTIYANTSYIPYSSRTLHKNSNKTGVSQYFSEQNIILLCYFSVQLNLNFICDDFRTVLVRITFFF